MNDSNNGMTGGDMGQIRLEIAKQNRPASDAFSAAEVVPSAQLPFLRTTDLSNIGATTEAGEPTHAGPADDPDGDGLPNLLEYALGSLPGEPSSKALPGAGTTRVAGQSRLTIAFTPAQTAGLRYIIEASSDLSDWSEQSDITTLLEEGQRYIHTDSANLATTQRRFLRLRVSME